MKALLIRLVALATLVVGACASAQEAAFELFPHIVDHAYVKERALIPPREGVLLIDSRPAKRRYDPGHIPGAVNISDTHFEKSIDKLPADKSTELIFYCGGFDCPLSHKSAFKAQELGYRNVAVYAAGMPDWEAQGELVAVSLAAVKELIDNPDGTVLIDSRPARRFAEGSLPGAINIPDTFFDKSLAQLPGDTATPLIFFCGGLQCDLSIKSARKAQALGHTSVRVFPEGEPAWVAAYGSSSHAAAGAAGGASAAEPATPSALRLAPGGEAVSTEHFVELEKSGSDGIHIIDVRDEGDFARGHFRAARNIPVGRIEAEVDNLPSDKPIVFVCATGARGSEAYDMTKLFRPELNAYYLDADVAYNGDGSSVVTARASR
jgi:rhodanese-related sulfurtransferase